MGDEGDLWRAVKAQRNERRAALGVACPRCVELLPRAQPSLLLPQQRCRIHGYRDPRPRAAT
jgi:hypothetical protein